VRCTPADRAAAGPFVAVNCAALPETLIEAELFGYQGGAFTGARRDGAPGRVREAEGGTLFLDEIGDMPLAMQARLLRVLQDRAVVPLGGGRPVAVDFTLLCATHCHLKDAITAGRFRQDLYYRLNGLTLTLPPLRERGDLPHLVAQMLAQALPGRSRDPGPRTGAGLCRPPLAGQPAPAGQRPAHRVCAAGRRRSPDRLAAPAGRPGRGPACRAAARAPRPRWLDEGANLQLNQLHTVRRVLETCGGNLSEAARRLGISRNTLYRKLRAAGAA
jgi:transcriptional regulator with PAS, ATPase and Fis domain